MLILKRLCVWFVETVTEALLLGIVLAVLLGHDQNALVKDVLIYSTAISYMFFVTGYLLSTAVVRVLWRGRTLWSYPTIATTLFFIHFEIMNVGVGGAFQFKDRLPICVAGACIVFVCTLVGTVGLRRWTATGNESQSPPISGH
jgi:hypothetical protein